MDFFMLLCHSRRRHQLCVFLFTVCLLLISNRITAYSTSSGSTLGINYGMVGNNLPSPSSVVSLLQSISVTQTRIYSANADVLNAFANSGISIIVSVGNEDVPSMTEYSVAANWVLNNVAAYYPQTVISGILVGNEVYTGNDTNLMSSLLPAMKNIQAALRSQGLSNQIYVSSAHSLAILSKSYPPSAGTFVSSIASNYLMPMLQFLKQTSAPFMINAYPYFAYKDNPTTVSLSYVLSSDSSSLSTATTTAAESSSTTSSVVTDPNTGLTYTNMLDAQLDAIYAAMEAVGYGDVALVLSETGWPSAGDYDEPGASIVNAQTYNGNLVQRLAERKGTPAKPSVPVQAFLFALFNENEKPGPASERNYGLYYPNGTRVYDVGLPSIRSYTIYNSVDSAATAAAAGGRAAFVASLIFCLLFICVSSSS